MEVEKGTSKAGEVEPQQPQADETSPTPPQPHCHPIVHIICWTPPRCRWDAENPPPFTTWLNILYACAGGFTSANLFYSYPILNLLARDFHTSQAGVASIPTLSQAGAATGLLFLLPLGDFFPRRKFTITLVGCAAVFWIGLCVTTNLNVFLALTYLSALFTGAPQIMIPLVAELSTPEKRAFNLSILSAGPSFGILIARILSGIVANYTSWRNVYWLALGLQACVLLSLWLFMPDYPATNVLPIRKIVKTYPQILWSIVTLYPRHPVLVQAALLSFCAFFALTSYWTTLTFLLAGTPYHYNSIDIGLFGLVGLATMVIAPLYSKYIIQPLREPLYSVVVGMTITLVGTIVGTYTGTHSVVGPVIQALMLDAGLIIVQISNRVGIHGVEPKGRNRVNTAFTSVLYLGQLTGTKAGNVVYQQYGGWVAAGSLSVGVIVFSYLIVAVRGPYEKGWVGWGGGWGMRNKEDGDVDVGVDEGAAKGEIEMKKGEEQEKEGASGKNDTGANTRMSLSKYHHGIKIVGEGATAPIPHEHKTRSRT